jgi:TatD DNase family protein
MLADTHCHLNFDSFAADREQVLQRARAAGVVRILNPAIDLPTSHAALQLAESTPEVFAAVGLHPNDLTTWSDDTRTRLAELAQHPRCAAIGEIGLDYYWDATPHPLQQQALEAQLALAAQVGKPVVIHVRDASLEDRRCIEDCLSILRAWTDGLRCDSHPLAQRPGVLHSFSGDWRHAQQALALGFYLGVTGPITFKKSDILREVVVNCAGERLLTETDAPFLTPHPHRGQRNEPAYVAFVAQKMAEVRGVPADEWHDILINNAERLFLWQAIH